jgi:hypothetical protein
MDKCNLSDIRKITKAIDGKISVKVSKKLKTNFVLLIPVVKEY